MLEELPHVSEAIEEESVERQEPAAWPVRHEIYQEILAVSLQEITPPVAPLNPLL